MNKVIGAVILILASFDLFGSETTFPSGFYGGFAGGTSHMTGHVRDLAVRTPSDSFAQSEADPFSLNHASFQIRGGYLYVIPSSIITLSMSGFYAYNGGEHIYTKRKELALDTFTLHSRLSSLYQIGTSFKAGLLFLDKYHFFLMGGIGSEKFKIVNELVVFDGAGATEFYGTKTRRKTLTTYSIGAGLEKQFNTHIRLGIEGFATLYSQKLKINEMGLAHPGSNLSSNRTFQRYSFLASATYTFN